jgi:SET domain-containing protein
VASPTKATHFDQCNESIKPMVCLKSADKSDEEIIKSFSVKQKWPCGKEKRTLLWLNGLITNIFYNLDLWLWASNW